MFKATSFLTEPMTKAKKCQTEHCPHKRIMALDMSKKLDTVNHGKPLELI